jgi:hypothetical protein
MRFIPRQVLFVLTVLLYLTSYFDSANACWARSSRSIASNKPIMKSKIVQEVRKLVTTTAKTTTTKAAKEKKSHSKAKSISAAKVQLNKIFSNKRNDLMGQTTKKTAKKVAATKKAIKKQGKNKLQSTKKNLTMAVEKNNSKGEIKKN